MSKLAVVSGGMDSVTMLHEFRNEISHVVNFVYGSKHNERETTFAEFHASRLGIEFTRITIDLNAWGLKSDLLTSGGEIPEGHYADPTMRKTVVPFRNGIMLSIAAGVAESIGASEVCIANHFGDHAIYPDCRASFIAPMSQAIREGTYNGVTIFAPYTNMTKREIALRGLELGLDYGTTYSCYNGTAEHCGRCGTCVERKEALQGFDPTVYADPHYFPESV